MPKNTPSSQPLTEAEVKKLETCPEFSEGIALLQRSLVINTENGSIKFEISEIEPYSFLFQKGHLRDFDSKKRKPGEIFVTWLQGYPLIHIVVDPEERSIVSIKKLKQDGREISVPAALKFMGLDKSTSDYQNYKKNVNSRLDGVQTNTNDPNADIKIHEIAQQNGTILQLRRTISQRIAKNSLGRFGKQ